VSGLCVTSCEVIKMLVLLWLSAKQLYARAVCKQAAVECSPRLLTPFGV